MKGRVEQLEVGIGNMEQGVVHLNCGFAAMKELMVEALNETQSSGQMEESRKTVMETPVSPLPGTNWGARESSGLLERDAKKEKKEFHVQILSNSGYEAEELEEEKESEVENMERKKKELQWLCQ